MIVVGGQAIEHRPTGTLTRNASYCSRRNGVMIDIVMTIDMSNDDRYIMTIDTNNEDRYE